MGEGHGKIQAILLSENAGVRQDPTGIQPDTHTIRISYP
ncbi:hypothetical protein ASZ90_014581 [hydrocarbon metagenome]|uniref:Uncharacterized protein n=1 Tax=hydrocarbon metagenome TaxID=938273 RepID=A0A0W8F5T9_9ZZZZ